MHFPFKETGGSNRNGGFQWQQSSNLVLNNRKPNNKTLTLPPRFSQSTNNGVPLVLKFNPINTGTKFVTSDPETWALTGGISVTQKGYPCSFC